MAGSGPHDCVFVLVVHWETHFVAVMLSEERDVATAGCLGRTVIRALQVRRWN